MYNVRVGVDFGVLFYVFVFSVEILFFVCLGESYLIYFWIFVRIGRIGICVIDCYWIVVRFYFYRVFK